MNIMKLSKTGFSLIEIIISVAILIILWVVWVTSYQWVVDKSKNSLVESHLQTLKNTFLTYSNDTKTLPYPSGNLKFYNVDGAYEHNFEDENTFWVSGYITSENIPKGYLQDTPIDPRNNQYYGYAHTKEVLWFQVSWVVMNHYEPKSKLVSNWSWISKENQVYMPYLVKEYNGPRFITQDSTELFAYNPHERVLSAKIYNFSGNITINGASIPSDQVKNYTLLEGDTLQVWTGSYADIYYSDGSMSSLWDITEQSNITFAQMRYLEENNLFTHIKIALNAGSLWTKAVKLADKSEFQIETPAAVAAVRGTIFWMRKSGSTTSVVVKEGSVEVGVNKYGRTVPIDTPWVAEEGDIVVEKWEPEKGVNITQITPWLPSSISSGTGIIEKIPTINIGNFFQNTSSTSMTIEKWEKNICQEWFEVFNNECIEFIELEDLEGNGTWKSLYNLYQDVLQRKPDKKGFEFWYNQIGTWTQNIDNIKKAFKSWSYFSYLHGKEKYFNPEYICDSQNSFEQDFNCVSNTLFKDNQNWKVRAFAWLDRNLDMHLGTWTILTWSWLVNTPANLYHEVKSEAIICQTGSANLTSESSEYMNRNTSLIKLSPKPLYKNHTTPGFYQLWDIKWLFLDNLNCDDYLKYHLSSSLSLTWGFAIEMNVRGGALKRTETGQYRLFSFDGNNYLEKTNKIGTQVLQFQIWSWVHLTIPQQDLNDLFDTEFYKIIAGYDEKKAFLKILDKNNREMTGTGKNLSSTPSNFPDLYIWSTQEVSIPNTTPESKYQSQWNDIIDFVKIYTK